MSELIYEQRYWRRRLALAMKQGQAHHAIWVGPAEMWQEIANCHRRILNDLIKPGDSILDVGCGWGRLLDLMPAHWHGAYIGIDLSDDFIKIARDSYPDNVFVIGDARRLDRELIRVPPLPITSFNWAVTCGMEGMIKNNGSASDWDSMIATMRTVATRVLTLNYDVEDRGKVIQ